ncbi:hypothetical protein [Leptolyngbya sp. FACHB-17]|uniref:ParM/StbA family protein n=1 Tax=unclassified Leptolyngbya TaxID=2650499 RepID=UPI00168049F6|nr:hypothetical protein [Leptolyngbya sp. FACHB-17]MBD2078798.1 hypothetical protein [Leptolyngbya sp. FACHB-17]
MLLETDQNPLKVNEPDLATSILIAVDRGNSSSKIAISINGYPLPAFKIPSLIRDAGTSEGAIDVGGKRYYSGADALSQLSGGTVETPLTTNDKVRNLAPVVAHAIGLAAQQTNISKNIRVKAIVSSPFAGQLLDRDLLAELKRLENGFSFNGQSFQAEILSVESRFEGAVLLEVCPQYNGLIDSGYGTLLASYRSGKKIIQMPLVGGDEGGLSLVIRDLLNDENFLLAVRKSGATAPPSAEKLTQKLSEGVVELRGIKLAGYIKPHLGELKQRIEQASHQMQNELTRSTGEKFQGKIALVGGGASLLKLVIPEAPLSKWLDKHCLDLPTDPDIQTVETMHQLLTMGGAA